MHKTCTKCKVQQPIDCFYYRKQRQQYHSWCKNCCKEEHERWRDNNRDKDREQARRSMASSNLRLRTRVLTHYSEGTPVCACCKENIFRFLTIDHENNDGNKHRKEIGQGIAIYRWLVRNNFPDGFQTLCWNCQMGKAFSGGVCPHKMKEDKT